MERRFQVLGDGLGSRCLDSGFGMPHLALGRSRSQVTVLGFQDKHGNADVSATCSAMF